MSSPLLPPGAATVGAAFEQAASLFGDRDAYVHGQQRLSFAAWHRAADRLARHFVSQGVTPGSVVAIHLPSSIDYAICLGAAMLAGAVATGLNVRLGPREIDAIVTKCRPALLITEDATELPLAAADRPVLRRGALAAACAGAPLGPARARGRPEDPAVIIWTSGTTGLPKGAWFDHRNLEAAVSSSGIMTAPFDRRLSNTPFAHAGYMAKPWEQFAFGTTLVIGPSPWTVEGTLEALRNERITVAAAVPTQWAKLLQRPDLEAYRPEALRLCVAATAPAPPEMVEEITRRLRAPLIVRYAMTESPSISGTSPVDAPEVLYRTVGKPQEGTRIELRDDAGRPVPAGAVGRICIKGPCVMRGYWNEPDLTGQAIDEGGWLVSSDLGRLDDEGNLVMAGRAGDMYIRGGYNVYPIEVENVLTEHPAVAQAAVVGLATPVIGELGVAFVVPADPARPPDLDTLRRWCCERLADYKAPDTVKIVDALPLTSMMKIDKNALREALAHHLSQ